MSNKKYAKVDFIGIFNVKVGSKNAQIAICREKEKGDLLLIENNVNGKFVANSFSSHSMGVAFCECDWNGKGGSDALSNAAHELRIYDVSINSSHLCDAAKLDLYSEEEADKEILLATEIAPNCYLFGELLEQKEGAEGFEELDLDSLKRLFGRLQEAALTAPSNEAEEMALDDAINDFFEERQVMMP